MWTRACGTPGSTTPQQAAAPVQKAPPIWVTAAGAVSAGTRVTQDWLADAEAGGALVEAQQPAEGGAVRA